MNRSRARSVLAAFFLLALASALLAQSSPWPFPSRHTQPAAAAPNAGGPLLRVAFWNVKWFPGGRPNAHAGEEARQVRSVQADIVKLAADVIGFAEMRDWDSTALAVRPLPGFKVDVCSNFTPREGQAVGQQVAIASRLPAMSAWAEEWKPGAAITPPRGFAFAAYQVAPRHLLLVYSIHLKSNRGELVENIAIREESMRQLLVHMKEMEGAYSKLGDITWIVGGDFNTGADDPRFRNDKTFLPLTQNAFQWAWQGIPFDRRITLPADKRFPANCFDHIFYRNAAIRKAEVVHTTDDSSDHRAIRAELILPLR